MEASIRLGTHAEKINLGRACVIHRKERKQRQRLTADRKRTEVRPPRSSNAD